MNNHIIEKIDRRPCGCTLTDYAGGRKTYEPCVACGLMRAGYQLSVAGTVLFPWRRRRALLEAGNALAAVATTIAKAANEKAMVDTVCEAIGGQTPDEEIKQDQPEGDHPGQNGD
jgi:hypothetical protein